MPDGRRTGAVADRVAANIRKFRTQRGYSTYDLADRLGKIGWSMAQSAVAKIENMQRAVTVDDLVAFALVLDVSPNALLFEGEFSANTKAIPILTPATKATPVATWQWATGEQPLVAGPGTISAMFRIENAPHRSL